MPIDLEQLLRQEHSKKQTDRIVRYIGRERATPAIRSRAKKIRHFIGF